jgi:hypothetical protein
MSGITRGNVDYVGISLRNRVGLWDTAEKENNVH